MKQVIALIGILLLLFLYLFLFNEKKNSIEQFKSNSDQCIIECNNPGKTGKKGDTGDEGPTGKVGEKGDTGDEGIPFDDWFREQPSTITWQASNNAKGEGYLNGNTITDMGVIRALTQNKIFKEAIETIIENYKKK